MQIDKLMFDPGPNIYYDDGFRSVLEDHMTSLRESAQTQSIGVEPNKAHKFESDLYGLLREINIPAHHHWIIMRMNAMTSPMDFGPAYTSLIIPDISAIERIRQAHQTSRRVT